MRCHIAPHFSQWQAKWHDGLCSKLLYGRASVFVYMLHAMACIAISLSLPAGHVSSAMSACCHVSSSESQAAALVCYHATTATVGCQGGVLIEEGEVASGASKSLALLGHSNNLLAATPSGAVTFHSWPLQPISSGTLVPYVSISACNGLSHSIHFFLWQQWV